MKMELLSYDNNSIFYIKISPIYIQSRDIATITSINLTLN